MPVMLLACRARRAAMAAAFLAIAGPLRAQDAVPRGASGAAPAPPEKKDQEKPAQLVPPVVKKDDGAEYPAELLKNPRAPREARTVELVLVVDPAGAVTRADVSR